MIIPAKARRHSRTHLRGLIESRPEIKNAILTSGGGVVAAWPLKPVIHIIKLAATTPEILDLFGYVAESIESDLLDASIVRMRRGQLLIAPVDDQFTLKVFFPPTIDVNAHLQDIRGVVNEIRAITSLK